MTQFGNDLPPAPRSGEVITSEFLMKLREASSRSMALSGSFVNGGFVVQAPVSRSRPAQELKLVAIVDAVLAAETGEDGVTTTEIELHELVFSSEGILIPSGAEVLVRNVILDSVAAPGTDKFKVGILFPFSGRWILVQPGCATAAIPENWDLGGSS